MAAPHALWADYDAAALRRLARSSSDARQTRRLLALALIYEGSARFEAARQASVTPQIVRDWVVRFNAEGPAGLVDHKAPGKVPRAGRVCLDRIRRNLSGSPAGCRLVMPMPGRMQGGRSPTGMGPGIGGGNHAATAWGRLSK